MVECKEIELANQEMDSSGYYVLIKVDFVTRRIGVRIMDISNAEIETFWGRQCQDIYHSILTSDDGDFWFQDMTHITYLCKELKKAEIALATGWSYYQE